MTEGRIAQFCQRWQWCLLTAIVVVGALGRAQGLTSGTLYPDDAWVVLTSHFSFTTTAHMLVTTPGFTYFMRIWASFAPQTTWFLQLPDLATSLGGIVVVFLLATYFKAPAWAALVPAALLAGSNEAMAYAVHVKPYADDVIIASILIWAGEAARRSMTPTRLCALSAIAMVAAAWSFINAIVAAGVYAALAVLWVKRREAAGWFVGTAGLAGVVITWLYFAVIRPQTTASLLHYWRPYDANLSSPHAVVQTVRRIENGIFAQQLSPIIHTGALKSLMFVSGAILVALVVLGAIVAWRPLAIPLGVLGTTALVAAARKIPLGSDRTDAYLFPALLLLLTAAILWISQWLRRRGNPLALRLCATALTVVLAAFLAMTAAFPPKYLGGDVRAAADVARTEVAQRPGTVLLVEGTARWPWADSEDPGVTLLFGPGFNTGYAPIGHQRGVLLMPVSYAETGFSTAWLTDRLSGVNRIVTVAYTGFTGLPEHQVILRALRQHCFSTTKVTTVNLYTVTVLARGTTTSSCS